MLAATCGLGFVVALPHAGHGSPETRTAAASTGSSDDCRLPRVVRRVRSSTRRRGQPCSLFPTLAVDPVRLCFTGLQHWRLREGARRHVVRGRSEPQGHLCCSRSSCTPAISPTQINAGRSDAQAILHMGGSSISVNARMELSIRVPSVLCSKELGQGSKWLYVSVMLGSNPYTCRGAQHSSPVRPLQQGVGPREQAALLVPSRMCAAGRGLWRSRANRASSHLCRCGQLDQS